MPGGMSGSRDPCRLAAEAVITARDGNRMGIESAFVPSGSVCVHMFRFRSSSVRGFGSVTIRQEGHLGESYRKL